MLELHRPDLQAGCPAQEARDDIYHQTGTHMTQRDSLPLRRFDLLAPIPGRDDVEISCGQGWLAKLAVTCIPHADRRTSIQIQGKRP